ncbi:MAG: hypothetical protein Q4C12_07870 [Clostridia bacterium]|nr:hypothetical protein [Clostridia bacterium]
MTYVVNVGGSKTRRSLGAMTDSRAVAGENFAVDITDADEVFLITKSARDINMCEYSQFASQTNYALINSLLSDVEAVKNAPKYQSGGSLDYQKLLEPHAKLHGEIFNAVSVSFNASEEDRALSNEKLITKQSSDKNALNPAMAERAFYAGRYAAVCSSGYAFPRLGGIWTGSWGAQWQADWTTDTNVNLQVSGMNIGNLETGIQGYINFILRIVDDWENNAHNIYGMTDAIMAPPRTDGDRGGIVHFSSGYPFHYWNAGASWLLFPIYEYWLCHGDTNIPLAEDIDLESLRSVLSVNETDLSSVQLEQIKQRGYLRLAEDILLPLLTKQSNFWVQLVDPRYYEDGNGDAHYDENKSTLAEDEKYLLLPSYSVENRPNGSYRSQITINATMDIAAAKSGLRMTTEIEQALNRPESEAQIEKWCALSEKLPVYKYDQTGALREWAFKNYTENHGHRHISHAYPAWPEFESQSSKALQDGIRKAVSLRKSNASDKASGHGWLHTGLIDARQKNAEGVAEALLKLLAESTYYPSMMTNHNVTGNSAYCTDASITVPSIFMEALAYSNRGEIELLPSLPSDFPSGEICGMIARTCAEIDSLKWDLLKNSVTASITSEIEQNINLSIARPWQSVSIVKNGIETRYQTGETITINFGAGETAQIDCVLSQESDEWVSSARFSSREFEAQNNRAVLRYTITPQELTDGVVGFTGSDVSPTGYGDFNIVLRIKPDGTMDARNGSEFAAVNTVSYEAGKSYQVVVLADINSRTFSAWVGDETQVIQLAKDYAFRSESPQTNDIGKICVRGGSGVASGTFTVSRFETCQGTLGLFAGTRTLDAASCAIYAAEAESYDIYGASYDENGIVKSIMKEQGESASGEVREISIPVFGGGEFKFMAWKQGSLVPMTKAIVLDAPVLTSSKQNAAALHSFPEQSGVVSFKLTFIDNGSLDSGIMIGNSNVLNTSSRNYFASGSVVMLFANGEIHVRDKAAKTKVAEYVVGEDTDIRVDTDVAAKSYSIFVNGNCAAENIEFRTDADTLNILALVENSTGEMFNVQNFSWSEA